MIQKPPNIEPSNQVADGRPNCDPEINETFDEGEYYS